MTDAPKTTASPTGQHADTGGTDAGTYATLDDWRNGQGNGGITLADRISRLTNHA